MVIFEVSGVFWSFCLGCILIIFRFQEYFGHFLDFRDISVIFRFQGYLVFFRSQGYFGHFLGFKSILDIF